MRAEDAAAAPPGAQPGENRRQGCGVVTGPGEGGHRLPVGVGLGLTAVAVHHHGFKYVVDGAFEHGHQTAGHPAAVLPGGFGPGAGEDLGPAGLVNGFNAIFMGHVGHLMGQDRGQFVLVLALLDEPPGDEDDAAGAGVGVRVGSLQDAEVIAPVGPGQAGFFGHGLPDFVDIQGGVLVLGQGVPGQEAGCHGPADVILLGVVDAPGGHHGFLSRRGAHTDGFARF